MDKEKEYLKLSVDLYDKLYGSQIEPVKYEDIPNKIAEILEKCLKKKVEVKGNGLSEDIKVKI
jgi:hypothetical protein